MVFLSLKIGKKPVIFVIKIDSTTTIQPNRFPHDYSTKLYGPILFILSLCKNIRLKIRVFINLFIFICTRHSTIVRAHSYSLIHSFLICANIVFTIFMAVLPLYFVHSVSGSTDFIFRPLYS